MTDRHFGEALDRWLTTEPEPSPCPSPCSACGPDGCDPECSVCEAENAAYDAHLASLDHDCPRQQFLDDPITRANGVGAEMVAGIRCAVCDELEAGR